MTETANISEDERFVVNNNPWRWKGYYYDTESNLYYIRGRYYDPRIMQYIDADTPENIFSALMGVLNGLDRNAVVCNNIVLLAINNCTIQTYLEMFAHITEIDKERSTWWMWVVGLAIIILLALIALGGLFVAVMGAIASKVALALGGLTIATIAGKMLLGAIITAAICTLASGIGYYNNEWFWDWDGAAEGFLIGVVMGAISSAASFATSNVGIELSKVSYAFTQAGINAGITGTLELTRQLIVVGDVDMAGLVIAKRFGFINGTLNCLVSSNTKLLTFISYSVDLFETFIGELIELSKSNYGLPMMPQASMQYSY